MPFWIILIPKHSGNSVELGEISEQKVDLRENVLVLIEGINCGLFVE